MNPVLSFLVFLYLLSLSYICFAQEKIRMHSSKDLGPVCILLAIFSSFTIQISEKELLAEEFYEWFQLKHKKLSN